MRTFPIARPSVIVYSKYGMNTLITSPPKCRSVLCYSSFYYTGLLMVTQESLGKVSFTTDMWSDPNKSPFMAVTAHWIEATTQETPHGPQHILKLRADLIGFHRVPGRHDGEHLAHSFLHVLDRVSIAWKVCRNLTYNN